MSYGCSNRESLPHPYMLYLTGETTEEKLSRAGVDPATADKMLKLADEIQKYKGQLYAKAHPVVTPKRIKEINVVLWKDGGVYTFRLSQEPPPPQAYEKRRHILERK